MAQQRGKFSLADLAAAKKLPPDWLQNHCDLRDLGNGVIGIPYFDDAGNELFVRFRNPPGAEKRFSYKKGAKPRPYGLNRLDIARRDSKLHLCEGESDTWTLWYCGLPALGIPGADMASKLSAECIEGIANLYLLPDNPTKPGDKSVEQFVAGVRDQLAQLGYHGRLHRVTVPDSYKDVSDWYVAAGDKDKFRNELATAVQAAELLRVEARRSSQNGVTVNGRVHRLEAAGPQDKPRIRELRVRKLCDIKPGATTWLWHGYVPLGAVTILDGDPGLGKSTITTELAARVSRGRAMPPLSGRTDLDGPADVLIFNAEDDPEKTIRPRLDAAGVDPEKVHVIDATKIGEEDERPPILPADLDLIGELAREREVKLIIVDPFMAYLDGQLDAHRDQDVRRCLHRLKMLAETTGAAVLLVRHLNKLTGGPAIYRGGGSIGISGAARSVLMVGKNPADEKQNIFAAVKCNLCAMPPALTYSIETADNSMSQIGWGQETTVDADQLLGHRRQGTSIAEDCAELIRTLLAAGPKPATDMEEELKANGFSDNAIRDGRKRAKVRASKDSFDGGWTWQLPSPNAESNRDEDLQIPPGW